LIFSKLANIIYSIKDGTFIKLKDRTAAAETLANVLKEEVKKYNSSEILILGIPRGGVIMADIITKRLNNSSFDIIIPRKLRSPYNPESSVGAIIKDFDTNTIETYLDQKFIDYTNIPSKYIEQETERQVNEINRRAAIYGNGIQKEMINDKLIILVDDGAAMGATLIVSIRWIKKFNPKKIIIAITGASKDTIDILNQEGIDKVEALITPSAKKFYSVFQFYQNFQQVEDQTVVYILKNK
jgi:predicted phosphoribosyltransferase